MAPQMQVLQVRTVIWFKMRPRALIVYPHPVESLPGDLYPQRRARRGFCLWVVDDGETCLDWL